MWDIKLKATNKQTRKQIKMYTHRQQYGGYQKKKGDGGVVKDKVGQICGVRRRFDFGWWAHNAIYR